MEKMTARERMLRTFRHEETDRVPMVDSAWKGTIARWHREGLPENVSWEDYFGFDKVISIKPDNSPRYERKVLEQTDRYEIVTTPWGMTQKNFFTLDSTPEPLDFRYCDRESWQEAKERMLTYYDDRIPWDYIKNNYAKWKEEGCFLQLILWFGFDVSHSHMAGTENILIGMYDDPEWVTDVWDTYLKTSEMLCQKLLDAGYEFDGIKWFDDMGYKGTTFFSPELYRTLLKPFHKQAVDWAHERNMVTYLHSCGYIEPLLSDLVEIGVEMLNPLEVKAGMDPYKIKAEYGDKLAFHGGVNAQLWSDANMVLPEIERLLPVLKEGGGYVFGSDHSIPNNVSFDTMKQITALVKRLGKNY